MLNWKHPSDYRLSSFLIILVMMCLVGNLKSAEPYTRSTYHCLSVYWSRTNEGSCKVEYRSKGTSDWHPAQDLPYDSYTGTPVQNQYRGSIVNLTPGTEYEVRLTAGSESKMITASTWSENPKIKKTIKIENLSETYTTSEGGNEKEGWVLYDGTGSVINPEFKSNFGISVTNSFVIIRGFTIKNTKSHSVSLEGQIHDIIVENCVMTDFGDKETWKDPSGKSLPPDALFSDHSAGVNVKPEVKRVTIQRCDISHPRYTSTYWGQFPFRSGHPNGANAIRIGNGDDLLPWEANHVVRYNHLHSDSEHLFEDVLGGYPNYSKTGFPGADSDVYCNIIQNGTDDLIEADGGGQNVRIWGELSGWWNVRSQPSELYRRSCLYF